MGMKNVHLCVILIVDTIKEADYRKMIDVLKEYDMRLMYIIQSTLVTQEDYHEFKGRY